MNHQVSRKKRIYHPPTFNMPDIPREMWCDFRTDMIEHHMTLKQIAEKYYCDPRTVRTCIQNNKSSTELGKRSTPPRIQAFDHVITKVLLENIDSLPEDVSTVYRLSSFLYPLLADCSCSERTLRDHLRKSPYAKALLEIQEQKKRLKQELRESSRLEKQ